jgi:hypothetical protein
MNQIEPRLLAAVEFLPECLLPSALLRGYLTESDLRKVDAAVLGEARISGRNLLELKGEMGEIVNETRQRLADLANAPDPDRQQRAVSKLYDLRAALQQVPRSICLR